MSLESEASQLLFNLCSQATQTLHSDTLKETIPDDGLEIWPNAGASFNIGIMLFRPESKEFVGELALTDSTETFVVTKEPFIVPLSGFGQSCRFPEG